MKRAGVLGTFVWDTIHHPDRAARGPLLQWGGIAYSLSAIDAACPPGWSVVPLIRVGEDLAEAALVFLGGLGSISTDAGVRVVPEATNRVELRYLDNAERTERLTGGVPPWPWEELAPLLDGLDALYINYISGFELELATARRARDHFGGTIYADLHSLFLGAPGEGPRRPRALPSGWEWLATADYLQMNEAELALLREGGAAVPGGDQNGPTLLVTAGARGAFYRVPAMHGAPVSDRLDAPPGIAVPLREPAMPGDPTGCGDVWGGVVFSGILEGRSLVDAMTRGHRAAAAKMAHERMDGLAPAIRRALDPGDGRRDELAGTAG